MRCPDRSFAARPTLLALALVAAYGAASAADAEKPAVETEASVGIGLGLVSGDSNERAQFGQYNGLRNAPTAFGLVGFDYWRNDPGDGTAITFLGTNLGLQTREVLFDWSKQGDWKLRADYNEQLHYDPYSVNTGGIGFGTTAPQVVVLPNGPGTGEEYDLKIKRTALGLGLWKSFGPSMFAEVKLNSEDRNGAVMFGSGFTCPSPTAPGCVGASNARTGSAVLFLPQPVDSNTTLVDARFTYADKTLNLSAGYYGSFYRNTNGSMSPLVPGSLNNPVGTLLPLNTGLQPILNLPLALPPDNDAQFLDVTGNVRLGETTQLKFKASYSWATQNQSFASSGLANAPAGVDSLGGTANTGVALLGITSRPSPKLLLVADASYQTRNDQTPIAVYNVEGANTYTNRSYPLQTLRARLGAGYQFTTDYRGTLDVGYESLDRGTFTPTSAVAGVSALRQTTDETGVRLEVRRRMVDGVSGALSVASSWRNGSDWLKPNSGTGVTEVTDPSTAFTSTAIFPYSLANRQRDKVKLTVNWQATDELALNFLAEGGRDTFSSPTAYLEGLEKTSLNLFSIDLDYVLSDKWRFNGYLSNGSQQVHQTRPAGYVLSYKDTTWNVGVGFTGTPTESLKIGGMLSYVDDTSAYAQTLQPTASQANVTLLDVAGGLPDVVFKQAILNLYATYDIDKNSAVRANLVYQYNVVKDWVWGYGSTPFAYADATTLYQQPNQSVGMIGVTYVYKF